MLENQLKQEKVENKTYQQHIKKLQGDLPPMDSEIDRVLATKKILAQKESTIHILNKKLNIQTIQLIRASDLIFLEKGRVRGLALHPICFATYLCHMNDHHH